MDCLICKESRVPAVLYENNSDAEPHDNRKLIVDLVVDEASLVMKRN